MLSPASRGLPAGAALAIQKAQLLGYRDRPCDRGDVLVSEGPERFQVGGECVGDDLCPARVFRIPALDNKNNVHVTVA